MEGIEATEEMIVNIEEKANLAKEKSGKVVSWLEHPHYTTQKIKFILYWNYLVKNFKIYHVFGKWNPM